MGWPSADVRHEARRAAQSNEGQPMKTSEEGLKVIKYFESCRLSAYPDPATGGDPWTVGYGDTGPDVVPGLIITKEEAEQRLAKRLAEDFEPGVERMLRTEPTQCQFDAMVSLAFNIGLGSLGSSTLVRMFNIGQPGVDAQFLRWDKANGHSMWGLRRRRAAERVLYLGGTADEAIRIGDKTL